MIDLRVTDHLRTAAQEAHRPQRSRSRSLYNKRFNGRSYPSSPKPHTPTADNPAPSIYVPRTEADKTT